jgi:hypothetical protein
LMPWSGINGYHYRAKDCAIQGTFTVPVENTSYHPSLLNKETNYIHTFST